MVCSQHKGTTNVGNPHDTCQSHACWSELLISGSAASTGRSCVVDLREQALNLLLCMQVLGIPEGGMEHYGKGPLLSAKEPDREVCWRRAQQLQDICAQVSAAASQSLAVSIACHP